MSGFDVTPAALDTYANLIGRSGGSVSSLYINQAETYRFSYIKLDSDSGGLIFHQIVEETRKVSDALRAGNVRANEITFASASHLADSATSYRTTDHGAAEKLDKQYQPTGTQKPTESLLEGDPPKAPASSLTAPSAGDDGENLAEQILSYAGVDSIGAFVLKICDIFGFQPQEWITEKLLGNAGDVAKVSDALTKYAAFDLACAETVAEGLQTMTSQWKGEAATAATDYFAKLANGLQDRSHALKSLATKYDEFHTFLTWAADKIGDALQFVVQKAGEVAAALGGATCLSAIPGVNAIAAIIGASTVYRLVRAIQDLIELWDEVKGLIDTNIAAVSLASAELGKWASSALHLPKGSYQNGSQPQAPVEDRPTPRNVR